MFTGEMKFTDRIEAGEMLAAELVVYKNTNSIVLAIPRGGVPVGYIIASQLCLPLELILSKKIGHPVQPEFAIGAVTLESLIIDPEYEHLKQHINRSVIALKEKLKQKYTELGSKLTNEMIRGKTVIVTDDGVATGKTILASISLLRKAEPSAIVIAVPVCSAEAYSLLLEEADNVVCLHTDENFYGVGQFYEDFAQVSDEEVRDYLARSGSKIN